jgi:hypothetical protein
LTALFPYSRHRFPKFFVRDVQIPLRLLDVGVAEHQLDRADVYAVAQEPAGAFVTEIVPVQVDLPELLAIDASTVFRAFRVVPVRDKQQRLPSGLEALHVLPAGEPNTNALGPSGIVADIRYREIVSAPLDVYVAFQQSRFGVGDLMIRTSTPPASVTPAVRARLRQISPDGIFDVASMEQVVAAHEAPWNANLLFFALFAGLTMLLAVVGLYAMLASSVAEQWRDIGVRRALAASERRIVHDVLMDGTRVAIPGMLAGIVACAVTNRFMGALLFETRPLDPPTLVGVVITVLAISLIAGAFPAWRAARVDPAVCLRAE